MSQPLTSQIYLKSIVIALLLPRFPLGLLAVTVPPYARLEQLGRGVCPGHCVWKIHYAFDW